MSPQPANYWVLRCCACHHEHFYMSGANIAAGLGDQIASELCQLCLGKVMWVQTNRTTKEELMASKCPCLFCKGQRRPLESDSVACEHPYITKTKDGFVCGECGAEVSLNTKKRNRE